MFPKWTFLYYLLFLSFIISFTIMIIILIFPLVETIDNSTNSTNKSTLIENKDWLTILFALMNFLLCLNLIFTIPKNLRIDKNKKFSIILSTITIYFLFIFSISTIGVLFVPLIILLTAASVNSILRK
ncbi:MAG: hypothetical protein CL903_00755 [Dehalococcoidia bacterium]|nr:hypothetical protein [Dehalococcoidia bacterium]